MRDKKGQVTIREGRVSKAMITDIPDRYLSEPWLGVTRHRGLSCTCSSTTHISSMSIQHVPNLSKLSRMLRDFEKKENENKPMPIPKNICNNVGEALPSIVTCAQTNQQMALYTSFLLPHLINPGLRPLILQPPISTLKSAVEQIFLWLYTLSEYHWAIMEPNLPIQIEEVAYHIHEVNRSHFSYLGAHLNLMVNIVISPTDDVTEKRMYFLNTLVGIDLVGTGYALHRATTQTHKWIDGFIILTQHAYSYPPERAAIASFIDSTFPALDCKPSRRGLIQTKFPALWLSLTLSSITSIQTINWDTIKLLLDVIYELLQAGPVVVVATSGDRLARIIIRVMESHNPEAQVKVRKISELLVKAAWNPSIVRNLTPQIERYCKKHGRIADESICSLTEALRQGQMLRREWLDANNGVQCYQVRLFFFRCMDGQRLFEIVPKTYESHSFKVVYGLFRLFLLQS
jgi:hypothetical protein